MALHEIAVGIDGSTTATDAFAWAAGLAQRSEAMVRAIHVLEPPFVCTYPWSTPSTEQAMARARVTIRETLEATGGACHVESAIVRGAPGPALVRESTGADLLVVGCTGGALVNYTPEFGEVMGGSTARYAAHHAAIPMVAVRPDAEWVDAPDVVVGIDGSPTSLTALRWALEELPSEATIHAVQAVTIDCEEGSVPSDYELLDHDVDGYRSELRRLVEGVVDQAGAGGERSVSTHVVVGSAEDALTNPDFACDLIVVGEHGETAADDRPLGSVSEHTLRHAPVPLIIVPSPDRTTP